MKQRREKVGQNTFSRAQDAALALCQSKYGPCPFGCAKDGAANCDHHVTRRDCAPSRETS